MEILILGAIGGFIGGFAIAKIEIYFKRRKIMEKVKNSAEKFQIEGVNAEIQMLKKEGKISSAGEISDGYHTFNQIYHHRAILFASILELIPSKYTWKSKLHHDGTMYNV